MAPNTTESDETLSIFAQRGAVPVTSWGHLKATAKSCAQEAMMGSASKTTGFRRTVRETPSYRRLKSAVLAKATGTHRSAPHQKAYAESLEAAVHKLKAQQDAEHKAKLKSRLSSKTKELSTLQMRLQEMHMSGVEGETKDALKRQCEWIERMVDNLVKELKKC